MAPHSSILAWDVPWKEEPSGLQSMPQKESDTIEQQHTHTSLYLYYLKWCLEYVV